MTPTENLYYAIGEIAYAVALSDGRIQKDEVNKLHGILSTELSFSMEEQSIADIIFHVLNKDHTKAEAAYESGMNQIRLNSQYLSPELKLSFLRIAEKLAQAFPPRLKVENKMIERFRSDLTLINGDPVMYEK